VLDFRKSLWRLAFTAALGVALYETVLVLRLKTAMRVGEENLQRLIAEERSARVTASEANRELAHATSIGDPFLERTGIDESALTAEITAWLARVSALRRALAEHPEKNRPEIRMLTDEDWLSAAREIWSASTEFDATGSRTTIDFLPNLNSLRRRSQWSFAEQLLKAVKAYQRKTGGELPGGFDELAPFLPSTFGPEIAERYDFSRHNGRVVVVEKLREPEDIPPAPRPGPAREPDPDDDDSDEVEPERFIYFEFSAHPLDRPTIHNESKTEREVREAALRYRSANNGKRPTKPEQLSPFLSQAIPPAELTRAFSEMENSASDP
jgi:hypothetical protein